VYLSLGQKDFAANVNVTSEPMRTSNSRCASKVVRRAGRRARIEFRHRQGQHPPDSLPRLDSVIEFMTHKKSGAHRDRRPHDNVGSKSRQQVAVTEGAESVRDLVRRVSTRSRIEAKGCGDERPMVPGDSDANRQKNRRIEATDAREA
jgi:hypothetical protein